MQKWCNAYGLMKTSFYSFPFKISFFSTQNVIFYLNNTQRIFNTILFSVQNISFSINIIIISYHSKCHFFYFNDNQTTLEHNTTHHSECIISISKIISSYNSKCHFDFIRIVSFSVNKIIISCGSECHFWKPIVILSGANNDIFSESI